jgi:hypothetical protein
MLDKIGSEVYEAAQQDAVLAPSLLATAMAIGIQQPGRNAS